MRAKTLLLVGWLLILGLGCNRKKARDLPPAAPEARHEEKKEKEDRREERAEPLPDDVAEAWMEAGAVVGWMGPPRRGGIAPFGKPNSLEWTRELSDLDGKRAVPAFTTQGPLRPGVLAKLPAPAMPFGFDTASCVQWGDAELKELAALQNLTYLSLVCTSATDAGLKELAGLKNLTFLDLDHAKVTDAGIKHLASLKSLTFLILRGTKVTPKGIDELKKALPHCTVDQ